MNDQPVSISFKNTAQILLFAACLGTWGTTITALLMEAERAHQQPEQPAE